MEWEETLVFSGSSPLYRLDASKNILTASIFASILKPRFAVNATRLDGSRINDRGYNPDSDIGINRHISPRLWRFLTYPHRPEWQNNPKNIKQRTNMKKRFIIILLSLFTNSVASTIN